MGLVVGIIGKSRRIITIINHDLMLIIGLVNILHIEPVSPGTFRDNILGRTRTYVEKNTVTYTSFYERNNKICIIIT